ncbi:MAG: septal ring lytic transglycosylase RlpA family protein [Campylobacterota bacterium]
MGLLSKSIKYSFLASLFVGTFIFTGCSSKTNSYATTPGGSTDIDQVYKYTPDKNIRNSKAMHRATLRSYSVFGVRYYPKIAKLGEEFTGIASWYGPNFHAKKTSNGETYDMYAMTAAHKTLPMNTMVRVDNLENNKSVIVRINDRGPFVAGRIIDLSNKAAHSIDMVKKGTAKVKVTVLGYNGEIQNSQAPYAQEPKTVRNDKPKLGKKIRKPVEVKESINAIEPVTIEEKTVKTLPIGSFKIQLGAFSKLNGAQTTKAKYEQYATDKYNVEVQKVFSNDRYLHKVFITGFDSYDHAQLFKEANSLNGIILEK